MLALVLILAALSKLGAERWDRFLISVQRLARIPAAYSRPVAAGVIGVGAVVAAILLSGYPSRPVGLVLFIGLHTCFTVVVIAAVGRNDLSSCACFGRHSTAPLSSAAVARNAVLMGVAGLALFLDNGLSGQAALLSHAEASWDR